MSKRRVILIDDKEWAEIRIESLKRGISVGNYFVDLHRVKVDIPSKVTAEPVKEVKRAVLAVEQTVIKEKPKIYTEEYRKKNPMENCKVCGKSLKFNCSH